MHRPEIPEPEMPDPEMPDGCLLDGEVWRGLDTFAAGRAGAGPELESVQPPFLSPKGAHQPMPRVAILDCDDEPTADGGDDGWFNGIIAADWLREEGDGPAWTWQHLRVKTHPEELPRSAEDFDGYVVPGSRAMVTEREAWMEPLSELIRQAHARGLPLVGICFGHQLIADALGGAVEARAGPQPLNCTVDEIELTEAAAAAGLGTGPLRLMKAHSQHVVALPPGATLLGSSSSTPIEIFSLGTTVLCCQGYVKE